MQPAHDALPRLRPRRRRRILLLVLAAAGLVVLAACQPPVLGPAPSLPEAGSCNSGPECCSTATTGVTYYGNLRYGHDVDQNQDLYLDARLPAGATAAVPAIVYVHGGGHISGSKCEEGTKQSDYLAQQGFAVFSVDYPLASATVHTSDDVPADVELAVQWVRTNAAAFGVNPAAIGLWGGSAGSDVALDAAYMAERDDPGARVQAVSGWSGGYDYVDEFYRDPANAGHVGNDGSDYVGCADTTDAGCVAQNVQISPVTWAAHDDPPTLLATSTDFTAGCESVEPQNAVQMDDALRARGAPVELITTGACAHAIAYWKAKADAPATGSMIDNLVSFFRQNLTGTPMPSTTPAPLPTKLTGASIVTPSSVCTPSATGLSYQADVVYGSDFSHPLYADWYRPSGSGLHPAVVLVHGGGFTGGDKCDAEVASTAVTLAQQGYVVFSVNYPLATASQPTFPNPVYDLMAGVTNLKANAATYGVDPTKVVLWGEGAGADLADEAALAAPLISTGAQVPVAVAYSGPTDAFSDVGQYALVGATTPPEDWASYVGCPDPVTTSWDPVANLCFARWEQASPALLPDPAAAGTSLFTVSSTDFTGTGTCETTPVPQPTELWMAAGHEGIVAGSQTPADCATGFGLLPSQLSATLAFVQAHLGT